MNDHRGSGWKNIRAIFENPSLSCDMGSFDDYSGGQKMEKGCSLRQWVLVPAIGIEVYDRFLREGRFLRISLTLLWVSRSAPQYGD